MLNANRSRDPIACKDYSICRHGLHVCFVLSLSDPGVASSVGKEDDKVFYIFYRTIKKALAHQNRCAMRFMPLPPHLSAALKSAEATLGSAISILKPPAVSNFLSPRRPARFLVFYVRVAISLMASSQPSCPQERPTECWFAFEAKELCRNQRTSQTGQDRTSRHQSEISSPSREKRKSLDMRCWHRHEMNWTLETLQKQRLRLKFWTYVDCLNLSGLIVEPVLGCFLADYMNAVRLPSV